jgi:hypothetical protein
MGTKWEVGGNNSERWQSRQDLVSRVALLPFILRWDTEVKFGGVQHTLAHIHKALALEGNRETCRAARTEGIERVGLRHILGRDALSGM